MPYTTYHADRAKIGSDFRVAGKKWVKGLADVPYNPWKLFGSTWMLIAKPTFSFLFITLRRITNI